MNDFYDRLTPYYHLLYPEWDASIARQSWRWDGDQYDLTRRMTVEHSADPPVVHELHTRYYAVTLATLERLLRIAG